MLWITTTVVILFIVVFSRAKSSYSQWRSAKRHGCESFTRRPMGDALIGLAARIDDFRAIRDAQTLQAGIALHKKHGHTYLESTLLGQDTIRTSNSNVIQDVFSTKSGSWAVEPTRLPALGPVLGEGILTKDGSFWSRSRTLLRPSFHKEHIFDARIIEPFVSNLISKIPYDGSTIDMQPLLLDMFVDTSTLFTLGVPIGMADDNGAQGPTPSAGRDFWSAFQVAMGRCELQLLLGPVISPLIKITTKKHWRTIHQFIDYRISELLMQDRHAAASKDRCVLQSVAQQISDKVQIRHHVLQSMTAAQDTTSTLVSTALFLLSKRPELWKRIRAEVCTVSTVNIQPADVKKLTLLRNVLRESLRVYPVFPILQRTAKEDTILSCGGGVDQQLPAHVAKGSDLLVDFYTFNRDTSVYGDNADEFDPDRWEHIEPGPWQYLPFGAGSRTCLGQEKALAEASYTLIRLAQEFCQVESRDEREFLKAPGLVGRNMNGCQVAFIRDTQKSLVP